MCPGRASALGTARKGACARLPSYGVQPRKLSCACPMLHLIVADVNRTIVARSTRNQGNITGLPQVTALALVAQLDRAGDF